MSEPEDINSKEWREWHVRHKILGGQCIEMIKIANIKKKKLNVLIKFIEDTMQSSQS